MKTIFQTLATVLLLASSPAHAQGHQDNIDTIIPGDTVQIDRFDVCRNVTNEHSSLDFAVHTDTPAEWYDSLSGIIQSNEENKQLGAPYALIESCTTPDLTSISPGDMRLGRAGGCVPLLGQAYCWGGNASPFSMISGSGQWSGTTVGGRLVHTNHQDNYGDPVFGLKNQDVPGTVVDVATSSYHSCAANQTGEVYCWGINTQGQLGLGFTSSRETTPSRVVGLSDVTEIDTTETEPAYATCAVKTDGTVWCWGRQDYGRLGNGAGAAGTVSTPTQVLGLSNAVDVSVGPYHACALQDDGGVSCWGSNFNGAVRPSGYDLYGTGVTSAYERTDVTDAIQVSVGPHSTCVLLQSGDVECWGTRDMPNNASKMGAAVVDDPTATPAPATYDGSGNYQGAHPEIRDMIQIDTAGRWHSCGLRQDGTVWCWGSNIAGKLGDFSDAIENTRNRYNGLVQNTSGTVPPTPFPVFQVQGLPGPASAIATGGEFACAAMASDDSVHCWGKNYGMGEFGNPGPDPYDITRTYQFQCGTINGQPYYCNSTSIVNLTSGGPEGPNQRFNVIPHPLEFFPKDGMSPDAMKVEPVFGASRSSDIISDSFNIAGLINSTTTAGGTIAGSGNPVFRVNGGPWVTIGTVANGDSVEIRLTSSADYMTETQATLTIGGTEFVFGVTTENSPPPATSQLVSTIISDTEYNELDGRGLTCTNEGLSAGQSVNSQDFIDQPYTGGVTIGGNQVVGCIGSRSCSMMMNGVCYGSWTTRAFYISW